ncbi:chemotaxis protein CheW [Jeotgalibacillus haloalkalitolerans]|uniref:Chemotaxis protein CheW n=1 Tax=Jeotgalibacillus haloalkalitolerans TaxID=3104292 RepID=A0ABU5KLN5_9BACL|nr:chemotaxis protein CheW [Jeotgalibacillus sp. HH7-29]MDZ5712090.1 chemotaxis protein CheW [Jeotgalibacillus sp. HH7-29]
MSDGLKVVVFTCGNEEYAISIHEIVSIEKAEKVTAVPHLPKFMPGITEVRGELVPVLDFEQILYHQPLVAEDAKMLVVKTEQLSIAIRVKDAKEIIDIPSEQLKEIGLAAYKHTEYFTGVAQRENRLITIIDPEILTENLEGMKEIRDYMIQMKTSEPV